MNYPNTYYIKIKNGVPQEHPFMLDNLLACGIDPRNSTDWMLFIYSDKILPQKTPLYKLPDFKYKIVDNHVENFLEYRDMTDEEKLDYKTNNSIFKYTGSEPDAFN